MKGFNYSNFLFVIIAVIAGVISIQAYWNFKNYLQNKQQFINEVQSNLDEAIDKYYTDLAERTTIGFTYDQTSHIKDTSSNSTFKSIYDIISIDESSKTFELDSINLKQTEGVKVYRGSKAESLFSVNQQNHKAIYPDTSITIIGNLNSDSIRLKEIGILSQKVIISIKNDSLSLEDIHENIKQRFEGLNLDLEFGLRYKIMDRIKGEINRNIIKNSHLTTMATSALLPSRSELSIHFENATFIILKRSIMGILLSTLLILSVIGILLYLIKVINDQKQLAEMKNDLISNITHEFKTPIATVGVALESMKDFNVLDDRKKALKYVDISEAQLKKLNTMVEKLLETASLDSDQLNLNFEIINLYEMIQDVLINYKLNSEGKSLSCISTDKNISTKADAFHLENAISNLVDNAIKYGGDRIEIELKQNSASIILNVKDNGRNLNEAEALRIFDKFYRVPTGNMHNVKGFGIGLYYSKKIIEKHGGTIDIELDDGSNFKIVLPNG